MKFNLLTLFLLIVYKLKKDFSMDIFFRQFWIDKRLAFQGSNELVIGADIVNKIWLPDTFFGFILLLFPKRIQIIKFKLI